MLYSPLYFYLSFTTLSSLPSLSLALKYRAPITELPSFSNLAKCVAPLVQDVQATIYANNCPHTDLPLAASCMCFKTANMATFTSRVSSFVGDRCIDGADVEYSSAMDVVSEFCSVAPGGGMETTFKEPDAKPTFGNNDDILRTTINTIATVTVGNNGQPAPTSNAAGMRRFKGDDTGIISVFMAVSGSYILAITVL